MSFQNDWTDQSPLDHLQFKNVPSSIRQLRIDLEQRLSAILSGFTSGETLTGIKVMPANFQAADPGAISGQIQIYCKKVNGISEFFTQDDSGNTCQHTKGGKLNSAALSTALADLVSILGVFYPVGCIYTEVTGTNPNTTFGFGTWVAFATGQCLVGVDTGQTEFNSVLKTGGEKTHQLTVNEMPSHTHYTTFYNTGGGAGDQTLAQNATPHNTNTSSTGGDGAHNNLQPYITVYFWRRTA